MANDSRSTDRDDQRSDRDESTSFPFASQHDDRIFSSVDLDAPAEEASLEIDGEPDSDPAPSPTPETGSAHAPVAELLVEGPDGETRRREITQERFVVGRHSADLALDDPFVSPWHAQLFRTDETLVLEDMNSYNGVFLRIADELTLEDRDELVLGRQRFVFRSEWEAPTTADRPERPVRRLGAPMAGSPVRLLRIMEGGRVGNVFPIGERLVIGGDARDVACPEDFSLADEHAEIVRDGDTFTLRDLGSEYGTFIRIHQHVELVDGDCFVIGRTRFALSYR